jgi:hypothetical protein
MIGFFIWASLLVVVCMFASTRRNRSAVAVFFCVLLPSIVLAILGVVTLPGVALLSWIVPLIAWIILAVLPTKEAQELRGRDLLTKRKCPHCFSIMPATAPVCATCARESKPLSQATIDAVKPQVPAF